MTSVEISPATARELTDRIKAGVDAIWELIKQAYQSRAWSALGYASWDDYCTREFGTSRIRLPREERQEVVASMREIGMSTRAIVAATGTSKGTVDRELARAPSGAPATAPVIGTDGKTYTPRPRPDVAPDEEIVPVTGTDGKTYTPRPVQGVDQDVDQDVEENPADTAETSAPRPRRPSLDEQFLQATSRLNSVMTTMQNLGDDDRLPRNREQVARFRSDLLRAIDTLHRVADQLS